MEWNLYKHEKSKQKVKSSPTEYTAPYFVSHLDSMSSTELTSHLHSFHVSFTFWNLCRSSSRLCRPVPYFFLSDLICCLSLCTSATQLMCEPCNVLQSGPRFDFLQPFFSFWNLCRSSRRLCRPVPYGPMQRLCHPAHFFSFVVSQNSFNSIKLQISNPRFPLLLFTLSHTQTHKLHYRSTSLSGYSAKLQCCKSHWTPCQHSGSTRCPINMAQGSQRKPSRVD